MDDLIKKILLSLKLDDLIFEINNVFKILFNSENWVVLIFDNNENYILHKITNVEKSLQVKIPVECEFIKETIEEKYLFIENKEIIDEFKLNIELETSLNTKYMLSFSLNIFDINFGLVSIFLNDEMKIDNKIIQKYSEAVAIALKNSFDYRKLLEINKQDSLTGLYNYREFYNLLVFEKEYCEQNDAPFSIIFVDIDYFKNVNDTYGHLTGSKLLIEVSNIFRGDLRQQDSVTRYGGDEFMILLRKTNKTQAILVAERLKTLIETNYFLSEDEQHKIQITASFGVATYPEDCEDIRELIDKADEHMYFIKNNGKNGVKG